MLCHLSIMTQLYHRLHQIPKGNSSREEGLVWLVMRKAWWQGLLTSSDLSGTESRVVGK